MAQSTRQRPVIRPPGVPSDETVADDRLLARARLLRRFVPLLLASPAVLILVVMFVVPVVLLVVVSFFPDDPLTGLHTGFKPSNYSYFWTQPYFFKAIATTFGLALGATLLTAIISYPLALVLNRRSRRLRVFVALVVVLPIFVSIVERSLGWIAIFGSDGLLDDAGKAVGVRIPSLLYDDKGIVIGLTNTLLPFMFLSVYAAVRRIDPLVREAAATLGASPTRVFFTVTLPLTYSGLSAGASLVFSLAASNVVLTMMLGGAGMTTLPTLLYEEATVVVNYPISAVIGVSISVLILIVINLILRLGSRGDRNEAMVLP